MRERERERERERGKERERLNKHDTPMNKLPMLHASVADDTLPFS